MIPSAEFDVMQLHEKIDQLGDKIIATLTVTRFYFSPNFDVQVESEEPFSRVFFMLENQTSKMFRIINNFEKKNQVSLPNYRNNLIDEVDLSMISTISSLSVLVDCYDLPGGMPFARTIIYALITELIKDLKIVMKAVECYCNETKNLKLLEIRHEKA